MTDAIGKVGRVEDELLGGLIGLDTGDHDRSQPHRFALVFIGPSDGDVHDGIAETVEQRHYAEPDIAYRDPGFEIVR